MPQVQTIAHPTLVWRRSDGSESQYDLAPELPLTIGREAINRIAVNSSVISKAHAVVRYEAGEYVVEDLKSSNGTRLNGEPIAMSVISLGDVIEIGDQQFIFVDGEIGSATQSVPERQGSGKFLRLGLAAGGTLLVGLLPLLMFSASDSPQSATSRERGDIVTLDPLDLENVEPIQIPDAALINVVISRAQNSGVGEVAALFDEAQVFTRIGRFRHAAHLFSAVLVRDADHIAARRRLATVQAERLQLIDAYLAEADRAFDQLRFKSAKHEWEQAVFLLESSDPRMAIAREGIDRATQMLPRE